MEVVVLVEGLPPVAVEGLLGDPLGVVVGVAVPRAVVVRVREDEELLPLELLLRDVQGSVRWSCKTVFLKSIAGRS